MSLRVLSLFDGISAGRLALQRLGVDIEAYYASEIDKHAITVTQKNFPDVIQLGDVRNLDVSKLGHIDLLVGGSPCTDVSAAGKQAGIQAKTLEEYLELKNQGHEFIGQSFLFWEYMRIKKELEVINPSLKFLLENVKMKKQFLEHFSETVVVKPTFIDSKLVSAQSRQRYYWTNLGENIPLPEDRGILLKDILETGVVDCDKSYCLDASYYKGGNLEQYINKSRRQLVFEDASDTKSCVIQDLNAYSARQVGRKLDADGKRDDYNPNIKTEQRIELREDGKSNCLTTVQKDSLVALKIDSKFYEQPSNKTGGCIRVGGVSMQEPPPKAFSQGQRVYSVEGKSVTLSAQGGGQGAKTGLYKIDLPDGEYYIRKLSAVECERLQTFPDRVLYFIISLKEILCIDQAKHFVSAVERNPKLLKLVSSAEKEELKEYVKNVGRNMNVNHQLIKCTAQNNVNTQTQKHINLITKHRCQESNTSAKIVGKSARSQSHIQEEGFVVQNVLMNLIEGRITHNGKVESLLKDSLLVNQKSGKNVFQLSLREIMQLVNDADLEIAGQRDGNYTSIISSHLSMRNIEQILVILYYFAESVTTGYIATPMKMGNLYLSLTDGYTEGISNTQRLKCLGNSWTVDVIVHILKHLLGGEEG